VTAPKRTVESKQPTGLAVLRLLVLVLLTVGLVVFVVYAVHRVGDLHMQALRSDQETAKVLLNEAQTIGSLGWGAFLAAVLGFGSALLNVLEAGQ
jgi:hypothetical protein